LSSLRNENLTLKQNLEIARAQLAELKGKNIARSSLMIQNTLAANLVEKQSRLDKLEGANLIYRLTLMLFKSFLTVLVRQRPAMQADLQMLVDTIQDASAAQLIDLVKHLGLSQADKLADLINQFQLSGEVLASVSSSLHLKKKLKIPTSQYLLSNRLFAHFQYMYTHKTRPCEIGVDAWLVNIKDARLRRLAGTFQKYDVNELMLLEMDASSMAHLIGVEIEDLEEVQALFKLHHDGWRL